MFPWVCLLNLSNVSWNTKAGVFLARTFLSLFCLFVYIDWWIVKFEKKEKRAKSNKSRLVIQYCLWICIRACKEEKKTLVTLNVKRWRCTRRTVARNDWDCLALKVSSNSQLGAIESGLKATILPQMPKNCSELLVLFAQLLHRKNYDLILW